MKGGREEKQDHDRGKGLKKKREATQRARLISFLTCRRNSYGQAAARLSFFSLPRWQRRLVYCMVLGCGCTRVCVVSLTHSHSLPDLWQGKVCMDVRYGFGLDGLDGPDGGASMVWAWIRG
jgi:hypothetical protein